jgi:hypothetical protein
MDRTAFFATLRKSLFAGSISQAQTNGIEAILNEAEARNTPMRHLAYMLATTYHETARTMQPVRETLASSDAVAIKRLEKAWADGKLPWVKKPYWRKDQDGKSWLGRGLVQITHKDNYITLGEAVRVDLVADPDAAMSMPVAIKIMFEGMNKGLFTGKNLSQYLDGPLADYVGARRIINGTDKDKMIAGYANEFASALILGHYGKGLPQTPKPELTSNPLQLPKIEQSGNPGQLPAKISWFSKIITLFGARK